MYATACKILSKNRGWDLLLAMSVVSKCAVDCELTAIFHDVYFDHSCYSNVTSRPVCSNLAGNYMHFAEFGKSLPGRNLAHTMFQSVDFDA